MATTKKMSDVGWIYHAPAKPKERPDVVELPPASQIPGLNEFPEGYFPPDEPKKLLIHEHDSPYIRLAKTGGRPDLLRHRSPKPVSNEAKAYPRVNWFYQDDIRIEEDMGKEPVEEKPVEEPVKEKPFEFVLPEYMVHQEYRPYGDPPAESNKRNILSRDNTNVFQREGYGATDKTVKIQENRAPGYGVRQEKQAARPSNVPKVQPLVKAKPPTPELQSAYAKLRTMPPMKEDDKPPMSKILSYGYARDWELQREEWESKHGKCKPPGSKQEMLESEYQANMQMLNGSSKPRVPSHGRRAPGSASNSKKAPTPPQHGRTKPQETQEKPDFFSLSKQDVASSKSHSRRTRSELQPAKLKAK